MTPKVFVTGDHESQSIAVTVPTVNGANLLMLTLSEAGELIKQLTWAVEHFAEIRREAFPLEGSNA